MDVVQTRRKSPPSSGPVPAGKRSAPLPSPLRQSHPHRHPRKANPLPFQYLTNEKAEASWVKLRSVTGQSALDEFLSTAELAGTDFTAAKPTNNTRIIHLDSRDPYLPTAGEERATARRQAAHRAHLTVPRRPPWDAGTTRAQLEVREREGLLQWRRGLADLTENHDLLVTPFERNLEVWRQLWRVVERSDLLVQIVDARDPLLFRSEDLERYVKEVSERKKNLLLVNKADLLTRRQRQAWADYFGQEGINFKFFSARDAKSLQDAAEAESSEDEDLFPSQGASKPTKQLADDAAKLNQKDRDEDTGQTPEDSKLDRDTSSTRILTIEELEELFVSNVPRLKGDDLPAESPSDPLTAGSSGRDESTEPQKMTIGLVGYPNVGKSSTINALIGAKKVSVSATPGKTKHFQTLHLTPTLVLCDCPGLVFPNFARTAAELVCAGILPVDQQRELRGPAALVARRIPRSNLESTYGIRIDVRSIEEGGSGVPTASELLSAYGRARGFATTGSGGQPDESRAARYILKDYVKGRLPFCHPPPAEPPTGERDFNSELYDSGDPELQTTHAAEADDGTSIASKDRLPFEGRKSKQVDKRFFGSGSGGAGHTSSPFAYVAGGRGGKSLSGRKQRLVVAMEKGVDPSEVQLDGKKHFKGRRARGGAKKLPDDAD